MKNILLLCIVCLSLLLTKEAVFAETGHPIEIKTPIAKLTNKTGVLLVSNGIPFPKGQLFSEKDLCIVDDAGQEIAIAVKILARWLEDNSIKSILVQFKLDIPYNYRYCTLEVNKSRTLPDLTIQPVDWILPEAVILLPAEWLCKTKITGEQVPVAFNRFSGNPESLYDQRIITYFASAKDKPLTGDSRQDNYYDSTHVFYQLYARTGDPEFFKQARKAALTYREKEIIQEGPTKGRHVKYPETRYIYVQAMVDDYLFTGDEKSLAVAGYMAEYLKNAYPPEKAFLTKKTDKFWTERETAFPFLGVITYYELTGDKAYLTAAQKYMENLHKTQAEWPDRGGFIHNLYFHDPEEGCRKDEYGGSPFMTGLLLEAVVKYHQLTGSLQAKESIYNALDWLKKEALAPDGSSFLYLTCDSKRGEGHPDLNLLIAHAFGYGYKISGYERTDYLELGKKIFNRGVQDAWLGDQKHFNQNYRSSGHFLAYIEQTRP